MAEVSASVKDDILLAARTLTGHRRRAFQAEMALKYCDGQPRQAERVFGWGRTAVHTGLQERRTGIRCLENFGARGRHTTEARPPGTGRPDSGPGRPGKPGRPKFQTPLAYTQITAKAVHRTLDYHRRRPRGPCARRADGVRHAEPSGLSVAARPQDRAPKKVPETDAIFDHLREAHARAADDPDVLRLSIDTKAKVKVGPFSRGGLARGAEPVRAADHDMHPDAVLTPAGDSGSRGQPLNLLFGTSRDTSDFVGRLPGAVVGGSPGGVPKRPPVADRFG